MLLWLAIAMKGAFMDMGDYFMQIHQKWQYDNIKIKDVKTVCIWFTRRRLIDVCFTSIA